MAAEHFALFPVFVLLAASVELLTPTCVPLVVSTARPVLCVAHLELSFARPVRRSQLEFSDVHPAPFDVYPVQTARPEVAAARLGLPVLPVVAGARLEFVDVQLGLPVLLVVSAVRPAHSVPFVARSALLVFAAAQL